MPDHPSRPSESFPPVDETLPESPRHGFRGDRGDRPSAPRVPTSLTIAVTTSRG